MTDSVQVEVWGDYPNYTVTTDNGDGTGMRIAGPKRVIHGGMRPVATFTLTADVLRDLLEDMEGR